MFLPIVRQEYLFYFRYGILTHHPDFKTEADFTADRIRPHIVAGSPEDCIRQLEMYHKEFAADYIVLRMRLPFGPAKPAVLRSLELFGKEVMPHFARQAGQAAS